MVWLYRKNFQKINIRQRILYTANSCCLGAILQTSESLFPKGKKQSLSQPKSVHRDNGSGSKNCNKHNREAFTYFYNLWLQHQICFWKKENDSFKPKKLNSKVSPKIFTCKGEHSLKRKISIEMIMQWTFKSKSNRIHIYEREGIQMLKKSRQSRRKISYSKNYSF